jgi:hypothetical protein
MTLEEVSELLAVIAAYDRRTIGESDNSAWEEVLNDPRIPNLSLAECVDAVILHYAETADFIMPAHILTRVKAHRAVAINQIMPAKNADPGAYEAAGALWRGQFAETQARMKRARAAVLAHPDLAERLTMTPLNYAKPEQWNGGVPAEMFNGGNNDSPRRAALLGLVDEALSRDNHRKETP